MNEATQLLCPECGHPSHKHHSLLGCLGMMNCECVKLKEEIELPLWKAEALEAREYIIALEEFIWGETSHLIAEIPSLSEQRNAYLATRVRDEPQESE